MGSLENLFAKALSEFHQGEFSSAEDALRKFSKIRPGVPQALHLLGLIALEKKQPKRAIKQFRQLIKAKPGNAEYLGLYGAALFQSGQPRPAVMAFNKAIKAGPDHADHYYNRALALSELDQPAAAEADFREALARAPDLHDARFNLGRLLRRQRRKADALDCFKTVLKADRNAIDALIEAGELLNDLGRFEEAMTFQRQATAVAPQNVRALHALGVACFYLKRYGEAEKTFRRALALEPDSFQLHSALGNLHQRLGRLSAAQTCFRRAMSLNPDHGDAAANLSGLLLLSGAYEEGWRLYEHTRAIAYGGAPPVNLWNGGDLTGKTIRVYGDQGVGDVVMFAGLLDELRSRAAHCVIEIDERLTPLFQRSFPDLDIIGRPRGSALGPCDIAVDVETVFSDLPRRLRTNLGEYSKPARAYLKADPARIATIRRRYRAGSDALLIGVAWRSHNLKRPERDAPLPLWGPIFAQPNARFISLQYGDAAADIAQAQQHHGVEIIDDPNIDQSASLDDLASQICALDLVVSISQSSAHFAGALGQNVLTMIPKVPDWRYRLAGADTLWYPGMTLYRQSAVDAWDDVIAAVAADIAKYAAGEKPGIVTGK